VKVAIVAETFPRNLGYLGTLLPKYMARLGADVHYVTLDLAPYWQVPSIAEQYRRIVGAESLVPGESFMHDGYRVHVMRHERRLGHARMPGLVGKLAQLRPDVVYTLSAIGWLAIDCALARSRLGFPLFTGSHTTASTFPLAATRRPWLSLAGARMFAFRWIPGRLVSLVTELCYAPTVDCAEIAWRFFGVQRAKVRVMHLGVDADVFFPAVDRAAMAERDRTRADLGIAASDIVCVYTGKFTEDKNPLVLAQAVGELCKADRRFVALFVGEGPQRAMLESEPRTRVLPFRPYQQLGALYRAADIAVWPTNESTSMLDAAACGLPLVVSDGIVYRDHVEGNGLVYHMNDLQDLVAVLTRLADSTLRQQLGAAGAEKMRTKFSWLEHARTRLDDFERSIKRRG
jgi:glycosyltransferase involved in cell wall biosynthesis